MLYWNINERIDWLEKSNQIKSWARTSTSLTKTSERKMGSNGFRNVVLGSFSHLHLFPMLYILYFFCKVFGAIIKLSLQAFLLFGCAHQYEKSSSPFFPLSVDKKICMWGHLSRLNWEKEEGMWGVGDVTIAASYWMDPHISRLCTLCCFFILSSLSLSKDQRMVSQKKSKILQQSWGRRKKWINSQSLEDA